MGLSLRLPLEHLNDGGQLESRGGLERIHKTPALAETQWSRKASYLQALLRLLYKMYGKRQAANTFNLANRRKEEIFYTKWVTVGNFGPF